MKKDDFDFILGGIAGEIVGTIIFRLIVPYLDQLR